MCDRLNHLIKQVKEIEFQNQDELEDLCSQLEKGIGEIKGCEDKLLGIESEILGKLAEKIRSEKLN
ncbi:MAG: hypothetical protein PVH61_21370 [Candidatus Aminicenantes bacterium]|jgi:exonuclease VII small subunit